MPRYRTAPRLPRALACAAAAALPALLVAGCSSDAGDGSQGATPATSASAKPAPVKYKKLPDACSTVAKKDIDRIAPKSSGGKRIGTGDADDSGSCLWSGLDKFDYRQLTVSLKRFDSDPSRGSGSELAAAYLKQQTSDISADKGNTDPKTTPVHGLGDTAQQVAYEVKKKDSKKSEDFQQIRLTVQQANAVVTVDYAGARFGGGKPPASDELAKQAKQAAASAVAALGKA